MILNMKEQNKNNSICLNEQLETQTTYSEGNLYMCEIGFAYS